MSSEHLDIQISMVLDHKEISSGPCQDVQHSMCKAFLVFLDPIMASFYFLYHSRPCDIPFRCIATKIFLVYFVPVLWCQRLGEKDPGGALC